MNRSIAVLTIFWCAACGRTESNRQQAQAMRKFEEAWTLQEQAVSGVIYEPDRVQEDAQHKPSYKGTIEEYRLEKQGQAADVARAISGSELHGGQKASASLLVGQTHASTGRKLSRDAALAWSRQADLHTRLVNTASAIALQSNLAELYGKITYQEQIAASQTSLDQETRQRDELVASARKLEDQVKKLEDQLKGLTESSRKKSAQAEELSRRAFTARGQAQYDLYVKSAQATNEADALTAKADGVRVELDLATGKLKVERTKLEGAQGRVDSVGKALEALKTRSADTQKLAADARAKSQDLVDKKFKPSLEELTGSYVEQVVKAYDGAAQAMEQAVESAESAAGSAPSEARGDLQLHVVALRNELGLVLREKLLAETGYRDLLKGLQSSLQSRAELVEPIGQAIAASEERIAATRKQAGESLGKAAEDLHPLTETQGEGARLPLRYAVQMHQTLFAITGEAKHKTQAEQLTAKLGQIGKQPAEQPNQ